MRYKIFTIATDDALKRAHYWQKELFKISLSQWIYYVPSVIQAKYLILFNPAKGNQNASILSWKLRINLRDSDFRRSHFGRDLLRRTLIRESRTGYSITGSPCKTMSSLSGRPLNGSTGLNQCHPISSDTFAVDRYRLPSLVPQSFAVDP